MDLDKVVPRAAEAVAGGCFELVELAPSVTVEEITAKTGGRRRVLLGAFAKDASDINA